MTTTGTSKVRGRVVDVIDGEEAWRHIDKLSQKYRGNANYPRREGEQRIIVKIRPDHVSVRGGSRRG